MKRATLHNRAFSEITTWVLTVMHMHAVLSKPYFSGQRKEVVTSHSQDYVDGSTSRYAPGRGAIRQTLERKEVIER